MSDPENIDQLSATIADLYRRNPTGCESDIDVFLSQHLGHLAAAQRLAVLKQLRDKFSSAPVAIAGDISCDRQILSRMCSLLLGRDLAAEDLASSEILEGLAQTLNTIFDALNRLISVINMTLTGAASTGDQTIRQVIGFHIEGDGSSRSLEDYLGQISQAFLTTQESFKAAAETKVGQILQALDPKALAGERSGGLKIGPLRKAEDYDILSEKIQKIRKWFDSGKFKEEFIREFEKNCMSMQRS